MVVDSVDGDIVVPAVGVIVVDCVGCDAAVGERDPGSHHPLALSHTQNGLLVHVGWSVML